MRLAVRHRRDELRRAAERGYVRTDVVDRLSAPDADARPNVDDEQLAAIGLRLMHDAHDGDVLIPCWWCGRAIEWRTASMLCETCSDGNGGIAPLVDDSPELFLPKNADILYENRVWLTAFAVRYRSPAFVSEIVGPNNAVPKDCLTLDPPYVTEPFALLLPSDPEMVATPLTPALDLASGVLECHARVLPGRRMTLHPELPEILELFGALHAEVVSAVEAAMHEPLARVVGARAAHIVLVELCDDSVVRLRRFDEETLENFKRMSVAARRLSDRVQTLATKQAPEPLSGAAALFVLLQNMAMQMTTACLSEIRPCLEDLGVGRDMVQTVHVSIALVYLLECLLRTRRLTAEWLVQLEHQVEIKEYARVWDGAIEHLDPITGYVEAATMTTEEPARSLHVTLANVAHGSVRITLAFAEPLFDDYLEKAGLHTNTIDHAYVEEVRREFASLADLLDDLEQLCRMYRESNLGTFVLVVLLNFARCVDHSLLAPRPMLRAFLAGTLDIDHYVDRVVDAIRAVRRDPGATTMTEQAWVLRRFLQALKFARLLFIMDFDTLTRGLDSAGRSEPRPLRVIERLAAPRLHCRDDSVLPEHELVDALYSLHAGLRLRAGAREAFLRRKRKLLLWGRRQQCSSRIRALVLKRQAKTEVPRRMCGRCQEAKVEEAFTASQWRKGKRCCLLCQKAAVHEEAARKTDTANRIFRAVEQARAQECSVCLNEVESGDRVVFECSHFQCVHCARELLAKAIHTCPLCRRPIKDLVQLVRGR